MFENCYSFIKFCLQRKSNVVKNFLSVEPGWPHNGAGTKISSNFDFNMLTLRIGPFGNFFKKFVFFGRACPGMPSHQKYIWPQISPELEYRFPSAFCDCSAPFHSTLWRKMGEITIVVSEKIPNNLYFGPKMAQIWAGNFFSATGPPVPARYHACLS